VIQKKLALYYLAIVLFMALPSRASDPSPSLLEARKGFHSTLLPRRDPIDEPPPQVLNKVKYSSSVGDLGALITPQKMDGKKHPALIWIHGGPCNEINLGLCLGEVAKENDQSGSIFRKMNIVTMYPSLRGGNDNPGRQEGFLGEVDDVAAAATYLAKRPDVDPTRIYLGGHSTGGTLALLTAECYPAQFRDVFCFGAAFDVVRYDPLWTPFPKRNKQEVRLRSPGYWLDCVKCPTFLFEGGSGQSQIASLEKMKSSTSNPFLHFYPEPNATHLGILAPISKIIADKILTDNGTSTNITFTEAELSEPFAH